MQTQSSSTLDATEVEKFSRLAAQWWDVEGKFAVLHKFNPVRLAYIKEQICARLHRDPFSRAPFDQLKLLDIGCGGGLLSEPMTRLGAFVTGLDPSPKNINVAKIHAEEQGLKIDYRIGPIESLDQTLQFDIILNMEVIEHVVQPQQFLQICAQRLKPGGLMFVATLNRTFKSFCLGIIGAEYVLGWLPKGTHQWEKFVTPTELKEWFCAAGLQHLDETGVSYHPLRHDWRLGTNMDINYMICAIKK